MNDDGLVPGVDVDIDGQAWTDQAVEKMRSQDRRVNMANNEQTIEVWDDSLSSERPCNGATCKDKLVWAEVVKSGKRMCFTAPAVPLRTRTDEQTGRLVAVMAFNDNHWRTCPDAKGFKRGDRS